MAELPKRKLGRTGLDVTVLGFGAMELRGTRAGRRGRDYQPEQADTILNAVIDSGINFVDTSIDYGPSEEMIGNFISKRRNEFFLASKCGCIATPEAAATGERHVYTRANIMAGIEQSLKRMKTDHLDLVQFHGSPSKEILEGEALQALKDLQKDGKVRFIGSSSTLPEIHDLIAMGVFDEFQIPYSALEREHEAVISEAHKAGAGTVIRGGVARGEPGRGLAEPDRWAMWKAANLDELAEGVSTMEFMLRFTMTHPNVNTIIVGTLNPDHLASNVAAVSKGPLPAAVYNEVKKRLDRVATPHAANH